MKNLFLNIGEFLKTLTLIDYILYIAILVLIVLIVSLIYLLKTTDIENDILNEEDRDEFDIKNAVKELNDYTPREIELNDYEKEQEENAIISYDELINSTKNNKLNYSDEEMSGNVSVKKFDLDNLVSEEEEAKMNVRVLTLEHEEAFLAALKQLQKLLD